MGTSVESGGFGGGLGGGLGRENVEWLCWAPLILFVSGKILKRFEDTKRTMLSIRLFALVSIIPFLNGLKQRSSHTHRATR